MAKVVKMFEEFLYDLYEAEINTEPVVYIVGYYSTIGQHGEAGTYSNFNQAVSEAVDFWKRMKDIPEGEDIQYVEVSSNREFAIIYITEEYLNVVDVDQFSDNATYETWLNVAKRALESGVTETGEYERDISSLFKFGVFIYDEQTENSADSEPRIEYFNDDEEAIEFAKEIEEALSSSQYIEVWEKVPGEPWGNSGSPIYKSDDK